MPYGLSKFCRFAVNVWEVNPAGKADEQVAREGLSCMEVWMKELGLTMNLHELGVSEEIRKMQVIITVYLLELKKQEIDIGSEVVSYLNNVGPFTSE